MPGNPHECWKHAKNCLQLAEGARTPEAKAHFEGLAQKWMELATDLEITQRLLAEADFPTKKPPTS